MLDKFATRRSVLGQTFGAAAAVLAAACAGGAQRVAVQQPGPTDETG